MTRRPAPLQKPRTFRGFVVLGLWKSAEWPSASISAESAPKLNGFSSRQVTSLWPEDTCRPREVPSSPLACTELVATQLNAFSWSGAREAESLCGGSAREPDKLNAFSSNLCSLLPLASGARSCPRQRPWSIGPSQLSAFSCWPAGEDGFANACDIGHQPGDPGLTHEATEAQLELNAFSCLPSGAAATQDASSAQPGGSMRPRRATEVEPVLNAFSWPQPRLRCCRDNPSEDSAGPSSIRPSFQLNAFSCLLTWIEPAGPDPTDRHLWPARRGLARSSSNRSELNAFSSPAPWPRPKVFLPTAATRREEATMGP
jgi:hypothetical protein